MALTKAQISLVTVATIGAAPGGFEADLANLGSQKEVAALIASLGLLNEGTNAEYALQVVKNLGGGDATKLFNALEAGASRADATVDFANAQLVAQKGSIPNVEKANASTSTSTDLDALKAEINTPDAPGVSTPATTLTFKDDNNGTDQTTGDAQTQAGGVKYFNNIGSAPGQQGKISADYTFKIKDQIGEKDVFTGNFLSPVLKNTGEESTGSQLVLKLLDLRYNELVNADGKPVDSQGKELGPLSRVPVDTFAFSMDGVDILVTSEKIYKATTYQQLFEAVKERIEELGNGVNVPAVDASGNPSVLSAYEALKGFEVELEAEPFTVKNEKGNDVSGQQIVLTDIGGAKLEGLGFINKAGVIPSPGYTLYAQLSGEKAATSTPLITTNLDADNFGYGSQGGSVNLAGQSASDKGVEEIKLEAKNGVWFSKLQSKAESDHLVRVELKSGSNGYFNVGTQKKGVEQQVVSLVDQQFADVTVTGSYGPVTTKGAGLVDVQQVDARAAGSAAINSFVSENVLNRYDFKDTGIYTVDDTKVATTYNLGTGNDVLNLAIDTKVLAAVDTTVNVTADGGNNVITVQATKGLGTDGKVSDAIQEAGTGWLTNQQLNNNIVIKTGAGNDWILTPGAGNMTINAGAGDDVVRVDNAGTKAVFVFNAQTTNIDILSQGLTSNSDKANSSGANASDQTFNFIKATVQVTFKGFESKFIKIAFDDKNFTTNTKQINQAIKEAIATDPVLKNLITAHDNDGNALAIESQIDGVLATGDLDIKIIPSATYTATESATDKAAREATGAEMLGKDDAANAKKVYEKAGKAATFEATTDADALYDTKAGTVGTGPAPFAANPAVTQTDATAGVAGTLTFDLDASSVTTGGAIEVGGQAVTITNSTVDATIAAEIATALNALAGTATVTFGVLGAIPVSELTFSEVSGALVVAISAAWILDNSATLAVGNTLAFTDTGTTGLVVTPAPSAQVAPATAATAEEQVITFVDAVNAGTVTVAGYDVAVTAGMTKEAIATAVHTAINGNNDENGVTLTSTDNSDGTLTIGYPAVAGNVAGITVSQVGAGGVTIAGTNSGAESDNVINLGQGDDLLVLGTGAQSSDTIKVEGTNQGHNTIVNFKTGTGADADFLDFTSYLTSKVAVTEKTVTQTVNTSSFADNAITIVTFDGTNKLKAADTTALTFDKLTEANVKTLLNNTDATGQIKNLNNFTIDATKHVLMLQSDTNAGEFKAFEVTTGTTVSVATDVKLIGTFDFGADVTSLDTNDFVLVS